MIRFLVFILLTTVSCAEKQDLTAETVTFRLPWPSSDRQSYDTKDVLVHTLTDAKSLKGHSAEILVDPKRKKSGLKGGSFNPFQMKKEGGVFVPEDLLTLQAATVYAHMEKLFGLDQRVGIENLLRRPRPVGIEVRDLPKSAPSLNNAVYDPSTDSLLIVPYEAEGLPLTLNAGVIAHEYFHAIFDRLVLSKVREAFPEKKELWVSSHLGEFHAVSGEVGTELWTLFLLRALNEGLADFWAWVYLADDNFIAHSLPKHEQRRRLDTKARVLNTSQEKAQQLARLSDDKRAVLAESYRLGTQYARFLRHLTVEAGLEESQEKRAEMAKLVLATLKKLQAIVVKDPASLKIDTFLEILAKEKALESYCDSFRAFVSRDSSLSCQ